MNRLDPQRQRIRISPSEKPKPANRARRFRRRESPRPIHLTDRDVEVLEALNVHRILSGDQLRRLVFECSGSRVRRRLRALYDHGFIERISLVAQPARGIPPFVYSLTRRGAEALQELDIPADGGGNDVGLQYARHRLNVNDVFITFTQAVRNTPYTVRNWRHEQELKIPTNDGRGRVERVEHHTLRTSLSFLPDAYFELELGDGSSFAFFVEVDLATHSQRVWRERAKLYTAYADPQTGLFRQRFGRDSFRLLIVTTPDFRRRSRRDNILESIQQTVGPSRLFLAATLDDMRPERILSRVWRSPDGRDPVSIVENAPKRPIAVTSGQRQRVKLKGRE